MLDIWNGGFRMVLAAICFFAAMHLLVKESPRGPVQSVINSQQMPAGPANQVPWR